MGVTRPDRESGSFEDRTPWAIASFVQPYWCTWARLAWRIFLWWIDMEELEEDDDVVVDDDWDCYEDVKNKEDDHSLNPQVK